MSKNIFKDIVKQIGDENVFFAEDGLNSAESSGTIDTGCYAFNAALSTSIYGGAFDNRITTIAGMESTGKTFFVLSILRSWLDANPKGTCFYFDTESAVTQDMLIERGIDPKRVIIVEPVTIEEFRTKALQILTAYMKVDEGDRPPMMYVLDSMGNLSSKKEIEDIESGKDKRDMTKAQLLKGAFRVLNLKLAKAKVPMFVTNHVYEIIGSMIPQKEMSGGSGLKYTSSQIAVLSKAKDRDTTTKEVLGNVITIVMQKNRFARENSKIKVKLTYDKGLDPYYGLQDLAIECGVWKKLAKQIETTEGKVFEKALFKNPEKYFTDDVMAKIETYAQAKFSYGSEIGEETE